MEDLWFSLYPNPLVVRLQGHSSDVSMENKEEFLNGIDYLDLSGLGMETVPDFVKDMVNLKFVDLSNNNLSHLTRGCFPRSIRVLNLSGNEFVELDFEVIADSLENLEQIYLMENKLEKVPKNLQLCTSLLDLDLSDNFIEELTDETEFPKSLISLYLGNNKIKTLKISEDKLFYFSEISLENNLLENFPTQLLRVKRLKFVNVKDNPLSESDWDFITLSKKRGIKVTY